MSGPTIAPDEIDFLSAFGVAPAESCPQDGYWRYAFDAGFGLTLDFSFCTHDTSVQTTLRFQDAVISTVSQEGASEIRIHDHGSSAQISVSFTPTMTLTTLTIDVLPRLTVTWASLRRLE